MTTLRRATLTLIAAIFAAGCSTGLPISWAPSERTRAYHGTIEWSCSPVDALALAFELQADADEDHPLISIVVWPQSPLEAGSAVRLDGKRPQGYAAVFSGGTEWVPASRGEVILESYTRGLEAQGRFWLQLDRGTRVEGTFVARWLDAGPVPCG